MLTILMLSVLYCQLWCCITTLCPFWLHNHHSSGSTNALYINNKDKGVQKKKKYIIVETEKEITIMFAMQVRIRNTWCFGAIELNTNATQRQLPKLLEPLSQPEQLFRCIWMLVSLIECYMAVIPISLTFLRPASYQKLFPSACHFLE